LDEPLLGHQPLHVFNFLIDILNMLYEFNVLSRLIQKSIVSPNSWEDGLWVRNPPSFASNRSPKYARKHTMYVMCLPNRLGRRLAQHLGGLFHQKEVRQQIEMDDSIMRLHCKKELAVFPSPAGMSLIKLFLGGKNLVFSRPERVWSVTSRLGTGKWLTPFYSVEGFLYEAVKAL
jgi:hypothetical protein